MNKGIKTGAFSIIGITIAIFVAMLMSMLFTGCEYTPSATEVAVSERNVAMSTITNSIVVPHIRTAQERQMVKRRAELFDVDHKLGYVYLITSNGSCIGYYAIIGKMASLRSYMVPQEEVVSLRGNYWLMQSADLDGTYGDNMAGVFFFTDNGTYVEIPAYGGLTPIYSDQPLPINAVKLNK